MGLKKEQCIKKSLMIREQNITIFLWKIFQAITFYFNPSGPVGPGGHFLQKSISLFLIIFFKIFIFAITADFKPPFRHLIEKPDDHQNNSFHL